MMRGSQRNRRALAAATVEDQALTVTQRDTQQNNRRKQVDDSQQGVKSLVCTALSNTHVSRRR